ncbi:MAG: hypothetical protein ACFE8A_14300 [Candidatus Hodarchaeota archaeon]
MATEEDIDIKELFYDIFDIVKFELQFYKDKESPMFEKIMKTRAFQSKLKKLQSFIFNYFERMYQTKSNPITKAALRTQLNNIARITNYYDDLSNIYTEQTDKIISQEKLMNLIEYSHIEVLFVIFTNILDWEHQKRSIFFPNDESKKEILKEFLDKLASSDIKNIEDIIEVEDKLNDFIDTIEFFFDFYFQK